MELLKQLRVSFIGIPDAGKSTLISNIIKHLYNKIISPDTLMNELEYSTGKDIYGNADTRTIKAAKIIMPYKDYEIMLIDCPGHLEYLDEINQGIELSSIIVCIIDCKRPIESFEYINKFVTQYKKNHKIIHIYTHAPYNDNLYFESNLPNISIPLDYLLEQINSFSKIKVDIDAEANNIIKSNIIDFNKICQMFSGGKDSIVGYHLLNKNINNFDVIFPKSRYDFKSLEKFIQDNYPFAIEKQNVPDNITYKDNSVFEIHEAKANFNLEIEKQYDLICINYRASDEGVRSKDHYIKMGKYCHRFSPVFYFSEENIWRYIEKYHLLYPYIYLNGYRSLGDEPVTEPSMPIMNSIYDIITYIHNHPFEERDGRTKQDNTQKYAMEKLRNKGFF